MNIMRSLSLLAVIVAALLFICGYQLLKNGELVLGWLWFTGLWLSFLFFPILIFRQRKESKWFKYAMPCWGGIVLALGIAEVALRQLQVGVNYGERRDGIYRSRYGAHSPTIFLQHQPFEKFTLSSPEFSYSRIANLLGYADIEQDTLKRAGVYRIIVLGDSFTEGDGAPQDSSYPQQWRLLLKRDSSMLRRVEIINAGICGSDPFFNFVELKYKLLRLKPDLVVFTNSSWDMNIDLLTRGGMERFSEKGVNFRMGPWFEPLYAVSYLCRLMIHQAMGYDVYFVKASQQAKVYSQLNEKMASLCSLYSSLAVEHQFEVVQLIRPDMDELVAGKEEYNFTSLVTNTAALPRFKTVVLLKTMQQTLKAKQLTVKQIFWPNDGHHNSLGYQCLAIALHKELKLRVDSYSGLSFNEQLINDKP